MKILVTEEGHNSGSTSAGEQLSANYLTEIYNRAPFTPFLEGIWWFGLEDGAGVDGYGLLRSNNTKKPAFAAFQAAANR